MSDSFPLIRQPDAMDCGPACLGMIAKYYGKEYDINGLRKNSYIGRDGVSMLGISRAAENIGFRTVGGRITFEKLAEKALLPCIVHRKQERYMTNWCKNYILDSLSFLFDNCIFQS